MKTSYFFTKNNLKSFFRPGWKGMGDPLEISRLRIVDNKEQKSSGNATFANSSNINVTWIGSQTLLSKDDF